MAHAPPQATVTPLTRRTMHLGDSQVCNAPCHERCLGGGIRDHSKHTVGLELMADFDSNSISHSQLYRFPKAETYSHPCWSVRNYCHASPDMVRRCGPEGVRMSTAQSEKNGDSRIQRFRGIRRRHVRHRCTEQGSLLHHGVSGLLCVSGSA